METERGRFSLSPSISLRRWFPSDPQLQTHQYRGRLAWRHFKHALARWEPHCGAFVEQDRSKARQGSRHPPPTCGHTAELAGAAGSLRLQGDAPSSLRCRELPQGCGEGSAPGCPQRSHPAGMWLPGGKAALPAETKGLDPLGGIPRGLGAVRAPSERLGCGGRAS